MNGGVTHIAVATDHVIESFRNRLWRGYKTSAGIDPDLLAQFHPLEDALARARRRRLADGGVRGRRCAGVGSGAGGTDARVERVVICTPDKDLGQSVRGTRVVQLDRRRNLTRDEAGVVSKFGVPPGVDSRLPGARRRRRRWLSRAAWLGPEIDRGGAREVRPSRGHPGRPANLECERGQRHDAGGDVCPRARAGVSLSRSGDAPRRTCRSSSQSTSSSGEGLPRPSHPSPPVSTRLAAEARGAVLRSTRPSGPSRAESLL